MLFAECFDDCDGSCNFTTFSGNVRCDDDIVITTCTLSVNLICHLLLFVCTKSYLSIDGWVCIVRLTSVALNVCLVFPQTLLLLQLLLVIVNRVLCIRIRQNDSSHYILLTSDKLWHLHDRTSDTSSDLQQLSICANF